METEQIQTPEQIKINRAVKLMGMGDKIMLSRYKVTFYQNARKEIQELTLEMKEAEELDQTLTKRINHAKAGIAIENYEQACRMMNYANTPDSFLSAASAFRKTVESSKENKVDAESLDEKVLKRFTETEQAEKKAELCEKQSRSCFRKQRLKNLGVLAVTVVLVLGVILGFRTSTFRRTLAKAELAVGMTDSAVNNLEKAYQRHKGAETYALYVQALYKQGCRSLDKGELENGIVQLQIPAQENYEDADTRMTEAEMTYMKTSEAGDEIYFSGEQWIVLDREDGGILLYKAEAVNAGPYRADGKQDVFWAESDLREYLNTQYYEETFTDCEKSYLKETQVATPENPKYGTSGGETVTDKVFILSIQEFEKYSSVINGCKKSIWLRSSGSSQGTAAYVDVSQNIMAYGYSEDCEAFYTKPVIWLQVD